MKGGSISALCFAAVLCPPLPAASQNLLENSNFDFDLSAWELLGPIDATWDLMDAGMDPLSGSVRQENLDDTGTRSGGLFQCVPVVEGVTYTFRYQSYTPSEQEATGRPDFNGFWYDGLDCDGDSVGSVGGANGPFGIFDDWVERVASSEAPIGARSVAAELVTRKFDAGGTFVAFYDDVELLPEAGGELGALLGLAILAGLPRPRRLGFPWHRYIHRSSKT